jgi:hypothetical protein
MRLLQEGSWKKNKQTNCRRVRSTKTTQKVAKELEAIDWSSTWAADNSSPRVQAHIVDRQLVVFRSQVLGSLDYCCWYCKQDGGGRWVAAAASLWTGTRLRLQYFWSSYEKEWPALKIWMPMSWWPKPHIWVSRNTREKADYSTFSVSTPHIRGVPRN